MSLTTELREKVSQANLTMERFREIVTRLLAYGVIVRSEDRTEELFYDNARSIEGALAEYLEIAGFVLHHDFAGQFFRLYAPGAVVDGLPADDNNPVPSMKARVSVDFVAAAIALRFLYQEKMNQALIGDNGEAVISFEDLAATLQTQLKRQLPDGIGERLGLLAELKRHRVLRYASDFTIADPDAYLAIRPTVLGLVSNEALATALDADGAIEPLEDKTEDSE